MKTYTLLVLICLSLHTPSVLGQTNAPVASPSDQLQQLTAQLHNSPDDAALRGRIIALALTLNPKPATPDTVTMAEGAAEYAFKNAQTNSDFSDAAKQYEKALLLAPWLAADYFNCGVAHEKAGENKEAIRSFNFYLLAAPDADDATAVKKRIGGLQYAEQKQISDAAAKLAEVNSPEAQQQKFFKSLDGGLWRCEHSVRNQSNGARWTDTDAGHTYIAVKGQTISGCSYYQDYMASDGKRYQVKDIDYDPNVTPNSSWTATLASRKFSAPKPASTSPAVSSFSDEYTFSDDGQSITEQIAFNIGDVVLNGTLNYVRIK